MLNTTGLPGTPQSRPAVIQPAAVPGAALEGISASLDVVLEDVAGAASVAVEISSALDVTLAGVVAASATPVEISAALVQTLAGVMVSSTALNPPLEDDDIGAVPQKRREKITEEKVPEPLDIPAPGAIIEIPELVETKKTRRVVASALRRVAVDTGQLPPLPVSRKKPAGIEPVVVVPASDALQEPLPLVRASVSPIPEGPVLPDDVMKALAAVLPRAKLRRREAQRIAVVAVINQYLKERT